jgi:hypothetical protein
MMMIREIRAGKREGSQAICEGRREDEQECEQLKTYRL